MKIFSQTWSVKFVILLSQYLYPFRAKTSIFRLLSASVLTLLQQLCINSEYLKSSGGYISQFDLRFDHGFLFLSSWESGNWSDCSASCGHGMQTRPIVCKQLIDSDLHPEVPTSRCDSRTRPESSRSCKIRPCGEWTTSEWGEVISFIIPRLYLLHTRSV